MDSVSKSLLKLSPIALTLMNCFISTQAVAGEVTTTSNQTTTSTSPTHSRTVDFTPYGTVLSLLMGFTSSNRAGTVNSTVFSGGTQGTYRVSASNTNSDAEAGLQLKIVYDLYGKAQPFIYINALGIIGASNNINVGWVNSSALTPSTVVVSYDWIARLGLGVQTELLFRQLQFGAGLGAAFVNQTVNAYIAESATTVFTNHHLAATATFMGDMTWKVCPRCIADHPLSLSLQASVDRNPGLNVNGMTPSSNTYRVGIHQKWIPHFDLVLNVLS